MTLAGAGVVASWLLTTDLHKCLPQERWGWADLDPFHACYLITESSDYIHCMLLRTRLSLVCTFLPSPRNTGGRVSQSHALSKAECCEDKGTSGPSSTIRTVTYFSSVLFKIPIRKEFVITSTGAWVTWRKMSCFSVTMHRHSTWRDPRYVSSCLRSV